MYAHGRGVPQDDATAVRWYRLAAEQEHAGGQYNLGWMYQNGRGVPQDEGAAYMWFSIAVSGASDDVRRSAIKARDIAAEKLTPNQLAYAEYRAREWDAPHPRER